MRGKLICLTILLSLSRLIAAEGENPVHDELRALRDGTLKAMNAGDIDGMLNYMHPEAVFTAMNGDVCRGHDAIRAYYAKMYGPDKPVTAMAFAIEVESLSILHGDDTAIAYGSSEDQFTLRGGINLEVNSRWSCTMVRTDGKWLIGSLHQSVNLFDNPVINGAKWWTKIAAAGGLAGGLLLGVIGPRILGRRKKKKKEEAG